MSLGILIQDEIDIPEGIDTLADFRRWAVSEEFPETGRIDYLAGRVAPVG